MKTLKYLGGKFLNYGFTWGLCDNEILKIYGSQPQPTTLNNKKGQYARNDKPDAKSPQGKTSTSLH